MMTNSVRSGGMSSGPSKGQEAEGPWRDWAGRTRGWLGGCNYGMAGQTEPWDG